MLMFVDAFPVSLHIALSREPSPTFGTRELSLKTCYVSSRNTSGLLLDAPLWPCCAGCRGASGPRGESHPKGIRSKIYIFYTGYNILGFASVAPSSSSVFASLYLANDDHVLLDIFWGLQVPKLDECIDNGENAH